MRVDLFDKIEEFSEQSAKFKKEFYKYTLMIARYDEVMCQKASLQRLFQERKAIEDKYDPALESIRSE